MSDILKEVDEKIMPNLQENKIDKVVKGLKITSSLCPYAGGLFSEIITNIIPNQRIDRMVEFLKILDTKLSKYGESMANLEKKLEKPESIELFEEAMWQSSRAISKERKEYIASILAKGLSNDQLEEIQNSVLLNILSQLNDNEIIILSSYIYKNMVNNEFKSKYENVLHVPLAYIGADKDLLAKNTVCSIYREKLFNLSLLRKRFKKPKKDTLPEFDEKTGMMKSSSYEITYLGSLFLDYIGLESDHSEN
ncbi:hypothetical protein IB678_02350 [Francisella adeliensis]|uniref:DUF4393 domain-containing protein n=1 Tax=Francisella adeliensis TaxID=2007306 RepID=A0A2Z4Y224_9GAMM|nr:hypothetical protein CDH04_06950 [Francisella adeliensis]MBK2085537.1 hypothetical protein [Francisella adeliensis]MBK2096341.1 hypothetical protein [Francisella adeliensis]QIW12976.1 hypothetical protein FZC43_06950 [Francisella adeliensis]QIW14856.1 hypothetical protein FZC44_06950 [Francisella adeliensis]